MKYISYVNGALIALVVFACSVTASHFVARHHTLITGVVDLKRIMLAVTNTYTKVLTNPSASTTEKEKATIDANSIGKRLPEALDKAAKDCRCILLVKEAFVGGNAPDYTDAVLEMLELKTTEVSK